MRKTKPDASAPSGADDTPRSAVERSRARWNSRRGAIIVMVLAFIVLLSFITVAFLEDATSKIKYYGLFHNRDDLRVEAYSALEVSLAVINQFREIDKNLWGPDQGWKQPLAYADVEFDPNVQIDVKVEDESGKFALDKLDLDTLRLLFEEMDFDLATAEELADTLLDWMDEDDDRRLDGFDGDNYEQEDPPYAAANRPLITWDELDLIHGWRDTFYDENGVALPQLAQFKSAVSLYNTGDVNINVANDLVLEVLERKGAVDARGLRDYLNGVDGIRGTEDDRVLRERDSRFFTGEGGGATTEAQVLRVSAEARRGEATFLVTALVSWAGSTPGSSGGSGGDSDRSGEAVPGQENEDGSGNDGEAGEVAGDLDGNKMAEGTIQNDSERRSATASRDSDAIDLGYPFQVLSLTENRKI